MKRLEDWDFSDNVRDLLATLKLDNALTVIVGAGLGVAMGLRDWKNLLKGVETRVGIQSTPNSSPMERADALSTVVDDEKLKEITHSVLYEGVQFDQVAVKPLLMATAALLRCTRPSLLITLNYDDLLEQFLEVYGAVVQVDHSAENPSSDADVCVWHPHGYLPQFDRKEWSKRVVLDTESFQWITNHRYWRPMLEQHMRRSFCLFMGLSGEDPHLKQHLAACAEHNVFRKQYPRWGVWMMPESEYPALRSDLENAMIHPLPFTTCDAYPGFLLGICQRVAQLRGRKHCASSASLTGRRS